jgi:hypothetical protein
MVHRSTKHAGSVRQKRPVDPASLVRAVSTPWPSRDFGTDPGRE